MTEETKTGDYDVAHLTDRIAFYRGRFKAGKKEYPSTHSSYGGSWGKRKPKHHWFQRVLPVTRTKPRCLPGPPDSSDDEGSESEYDSDPDLPYEDKKYPGLPLEKLAFDRAIIRALIDHPEAFVAEGSDDEAFLLDLLDSMPPTFEREDYDSVTNKEIFAIMTRYSEKAAHEILYHVITESKRHGLAHIYSTTKERDKLPAHQKVSRDFWDDFKAFLKPLDGVSRHKATINLASFYNRPMSPEEEKEKEAKMEAEKPGEKHYFFGSPKDDDNLLAGAIPNTDIFSDDTVVALLKTGRFPVDATADHIGTSSGFTNSEYEGLDTKVASIICFRPNLINWEAETWMEACPHFSHLWPCATKSVMDLNEITFLFCKAIHAMKASRETWVPGEVKGFLQDHMHNNVNSMARNLFICTAIRQGVKVSVEEMNEILGPGFYTVPDNISSKWSIGSGCTADAMAVGTILGGKNTSVVRAMIQSPLYTLKDVETLVDLSRHWERLSIFACYMGTDGWTFGGWIMEEWEKAATARGGRETQTGLRGLLRACFRHFPFTHPAHVEKYKEIAGCSIMEAAFPKGWQANTNPNKNVGDNDHIFDRVWQNMGHDYAVKLMEHPAFTFFMYSSVHGLLKYYTEKADKCMKLDWCLKNQYVKKMTKEDKKKMCKALLEIGLPANAEMTKALTAMGIDVFAATQAHSLRVAKRLLKTQIQVDFQRERAQAAEERAASLVTRMDDAEARERDFMVFSKAMFESMASLSNAYGASRALLLQDNPEAAALPLLVIPQFPSRLTIEGPQ